MAKYINGFLLPIKAENIEQYRQMAQKAGEIWKEHGALEFVETVGDDLEHEQMVSFVKSADAKDDEKVIFSFIVFESKEECDRINALVMNDERLQEMMEPGAANPFDCTRMAYGGFRAIVEL